MLKDKGLGKKLKVFVSKKAKVSNKNRKKSVKITNVKGQKNISFNIIAFKQ